MFLYARDILIFTLQPDYSIREQKPPRKLQLNDSMFADSVGYDYKYIREGKRSMNPVVLKFFRKLFARLQFHFGAWVLVSNFSNDFSTWGFMIQFDYIIIYVSHWLEDTKPTELERHQLSWKLRP